MASNKNVLEAKEQRACYGRATSALREAHREEFDALLSAEYEKAGLEVKRRLSVEEREARDAAKKAAVEARKEEKRLAKIAALKAELDALTGVEDDPMDVFREEPVAV